MTGTFVKSADYAAWLGGLKSRIQSARISAARAVNRELILLYWDIGRGIVEKQEDAGLGEVGGRAIVPGFEIRVSRDEGVFRQ